MRSLVVGYGSIGSRHARILKESGHDVAVCSSREVEHALRFKTITEAVRSFAPAYVVIANRTAEHLGTLSELSKTGFKGAVLVEKPLFMHPDHPDVSMFHKIRVGYNLRFHPLLERLRQELSGERVISVNAYVGKYLPEWRSGTDYRQGASARRHSGGGVLRDLSHELDLLCWLFGPWERLTALCGRFSDLEIDTEDTASVLLAMKRAPVVSVEMNYVDRAGRRDMVVNTLAHAFRVDMIANTFEKDGVAEKFDVARDDTYRWQHQAIMAGGEGDVSCTVDEALEVLRMVEAAETAQGTKQWVNR